ncbi:MAG TPA: hypothetical protein VNJ08_16505 [Bacteriovoracaceae bacterium]|nr:hypothetical protein [Bacteriovoracaceae bacterium]
MKVSVVGLGWYGTPLAIELIKAGHQVMGTTRDPGKKAILEASGIEVQLLTAPSIPSPEMLATDILILNIPPFKGQLEWLKRWAFESETWVILISSTSGNCADCEDWIKQQFKSWTILRFAGLLGSHRHPGNHLSGKKDLSGRLWPVNLLHQQDAVGFTEAIINKGIKHESINVLSDEHHGREEFYTEFAQRVGIALPSFDQGDKSIRPALDNKRARDIYDFKWPILFGTSV